MSEAVPHINGPVSRRVNRAVALLEDPDAMHKADESDIHHAEQIATMGAIAQGMNSLAEIAARSEDRLANIESLTQDSNTQLHTLRSNPFISFWRKNPRAMLATAVVSIGGIAGLITKLIEMW